MYCLFLQIYHLVKMDCYPQFKRSDLAKQCVLAEVEGRPLPLTYPPRTKQAMTGRNTLV